MYSIQDLQKMRNNIDALYREGWLEDDRPADIVIEIQNFIQHMIDNWDDEIVSHNGIGISLKDVFEVL